MVICDFSHWKLKQVTLQNSYPAAETTPSVLTSLFGPGLGPFPELGLTGMDQHPLPGGGNHTGMLSSEALTKDWLMVKWERNLKWEMCIQHLIKSLASLRVRSEAERVQHEGNLSNLGLNPCSPIQSPCDLSPRLSSSVKWKV